MSPHTASAIAHSNIALVKYWGKQDVARNLPAVPSLSLTLDGLETRTRVSFDPTLQADEVTLDGTSATGREYDRVTELLDRVRQSAGHHECARVESTNDFPTAAGLASSASGFAALAAAACRAAGLDLDREALSAMARQSSASAARSLFGGFVTLGAGAEQAEPLAPPEHWDVRLLVLVTERGKKALGSTEAMRITERTSPYYPAWVERSGELFERACQAVRQRDLPSLGQVMERSTLMMHGAMSVSEPAIIYPTPASWAVIQRVRELRNDGVECYFTMDAGPHVKVLVEAAQASAAKGALEQLGQVRTCIECRPGPGVSYGDGEE